MNSKALEQIIETIKKQYPYFDYMNSLTDETEKYNLGCESCAIVVSGVGQSEMKDFLNFIESVILFPLAERDEELPLIITVQNAPAKLQWKWPDRFQKKLTYRSVPACVQPACYNDVEAAEDYEYLMAA